MKYLIRSFYFLFVVLFVASCQEEEYEDVAFSARYLADMQINSDSSLVPVFNPEGYFIDSVSIDPASSEHFSEYMNQINKIEIMEFMGVITEMNAATSITDAVLQISSGGESVSWPLKNLKLYEGKSLKFTSHNGEWAEVANILNTKKLCKIVFSGTTNADSITFTMQLRLDADITADPR